MLRRPLHVSGFALAVALTAMLWAGPASAADASSATSAASATSTTSAAAPAAAAATTTTATPASDPPLTVTVDYFCTDYGFDVTNPNSVAHIVTLTLNGTAGAPLIVPAGGTVHIPLLESTQPATPYVLTDADGTELANGVLRFCLGVFNYSVTIREGTSYTLTHLASYGTMAPAPAHGTVVILNHGDPFGTGAGLRYTPDPCFVGTDRFGYQDFVGSSQGVVTVTVTPGTCATATPTHTGSGSSPAPTTPSAILAATGAGDIGTLLWIAICAATVGTILSALSRRSLRTGAAHRN